MMDRKKEFQNWFESKYCAKIDFYGESIKAPMMHGRTQGKSVSLCANVGWSAWEEASKGKEELLSQRDELLAELRGIAGMTDADDPESYRSDDREGCLDTVNATAKAAIAKCEVKS